MTGSVDPAIPTYRSSFGGLWPDLSHAPFLIRGKFELGLITEEQVKQLEHWVEHGYLIIPNAVPGEVVDLVNSDVERAWRGELPSLRIEHWENNARHVVPIKPEIRDKPHKLLDIYSASEAARRAIFSQPIFDFLALVFERPPMAFQSLSFMRGIGQPIHKDTAYVVVRSPMEFAASWIALEDIQPNSGALEYYEGSHRGEEYLFNGKHKSMPEGYAEEERYLSSLHEQAREMGLARKQFFPRKGDALIWSADLAHGGSPDAAPDSTRRSLVTHYCPVDLQPSYFLTAKHSGRMKHGQHAYYCYAIRS